ncbi:unnamed protein product [Lymnaea stagnalis]|uniref:Uncharacterized protein n=1 Tax=Lymnaea stagnalis TaxID=6523 RepID=A0AAV2IE54_LYMST
MQKTCPYPGFDETGDFYERQPNARVRPEAEEYAGKSRGCIDLFNSQKHKHVIPPPPSPRCPTGEARQNYENSRTGHIGNLLGGSGQPPPFEPRPFARVTVESEGIAESHKGREINSLLTNYGKNESSPRPNPRVKHEAEETADLSRGGRVNMLLHNSHSIPDTPRNAPRIKPEAQEIAANGMGASMAKIMGKYGETPRSARGVPRVKPEAQEIANLDRGVQMESLFHKYGKQQPQPQLAPKVKDGREIAEMDKGGRMSRLMHEINRLQSDPQPQPRAASSAGRNNIRKNRGTISQIFTESAKWQIVPKPGIRN